MLVAVALLLMEAVSSNMSAGDAARDVFPPFPAAIARFSPPAVSSGAAGTGGNALPVSREEERGASIGKKMSENGRVWRPQGEKERDKWSPETLSIHWGLIAETVTRAKRSFILSDLRCAYAGSPRWMPSLALSSP